MKKVFLFGIFLLSLTITACGRSELNSPYNNSPIVNPLPVSSGEEELRDVENVERNLILSTQPVNKPSSEIVSGLKKVSKGLLFPSEVNSAFSTVLWSGQAKNQLNVQLLLKLVKKAPETPVQIISLEGFLSRVTMVEPWSTANQIQKSHQFMNLQDFVKENIQNIKVYRVGRQDGTAYIIGKNGDDYLGLKTRLVER